jgi:uncharacterized membrane protein YhhN
MTLLMVPVAMTIAALTAGGLPVQLGVALSGAAVIVATLPGAPKGRRTAAWVVVALLFSAGGDWFLSNRGGRESWFIAGIVLFGGAHACFLTYALLHGRLHRPALLLLTTGYLPYFIFGIWPATGSHALALAVLAYLLLSCVVLASACGMRVEPIPKALYIAAMGLIVFSDTIISFKEFLDYDRLNSLIMPTYYLAHLCVCASVLARDPGKATLS